MISESLITFESLNKGPSLLLASKARDIFRFCSKKQNFLLLSATTFRNLQQSDMFQKGLIRVVMVTRPSFFWGGYHPTLKLSGIPTFTFIVSLTHRMDNIQINLQYNIKFLAIGVDVTWLQCHASLGSELKFCCCQYFFVKISRLHIARIRALR